MKEVHYDPEVDAIAIDTKGAKVEYSKDMGFDIIIDFDKDDQVIGVEVLECSKVFGVSKRALISANTRDTGFTVENTGVKVTIAGKERMIPIPGVELIAA